MTDSFSNLVHRPTMDQFTEGVASEVSSPAWTLVVPGPGRGGEKGCSLWCPQGGCAMWYNAGTKVALACGSRREG